MLLHDAVYPKGSKLTKATTKLQSLLDGPLVKRVLQGTSLGDEEQWGAHVWLIPAISILTRLCFRMEGMTELVNGTFIETTLLSSCAEAKNLKTFFEIDKEFESMMAVVKSNFFMVDSFNSSMRVSLRQALIRKLAHVKSADQDAWIKTEDHIAGLLNDDQMLTIENTDQAVKTYENYASRAIETNTTVLLAGASNHDSPEVVALKAHIAEMTALMTTTTSAATTGAARTGKRARVHKNSKTTVPKAVITCTVCEKNGHNAHGCWFNAENKLKEAAKMKSDAEDILKSKKSNK
jgi:hypothetical protein